MSLKKATEIFNLYKRYILTGLVLFVLLYSLLEPIVTIITPLPVEFYFGVVFILILAVIDYLHKLQPSKEGIFSDQLESTEIMSSFLRQKKINQALILAVSSSFERSIIEELLKMNCKVKLLMLDPRKTNDKSEQDLIMGNYGTTLRYAQESGKLENIEIAFYDTPASLRGINLDNSMIAVGWYTYSKERDEKGNEIIKVTGYNNPFIVRETTTEDAAILQKFLKEEFEKLWKQKISPEEIERWWEEKKPSANEKGAR